MNIAIFGSNSLIAKDFIQDINLNKNNLYLFSRKKHSNHLAYDTFLDNDYDLVVNFIGGGDPQAIVDTQGSIFTASTYYDDQIILYLNKNTRCKYIHISSGSAFNDYSKPARFDSRASIPLNDITSNNSVYALTKINLEIKHRLLSQFFIVDLRVFNYVSKAIGTSMSFFISNVMDCIVNKKVLICSPDEIFRDYIRPKDFSLMIDCISKEKFLNTSYDAYTKEPLSNLKLLEHLKGKFGLEYRFDAKLKTVNATGIKKYYYSKNYSLSSLGYEPKSSSLDNVINEITQLLNL